MNKFLMALLVTFVFTACGTRPVEEEPDGNISDSRRLGTGAIPVEDAGIQFDAGTAVRDGGVIALPDGGAIDGGLPRDGGPVVMDAGVRIDGGVQDAGVSPCGGCPPNSTCHLDTTTSDPSDFACFCDLNRGYDEVCNGVCVQLASDRNNCGSCGNACVVGQTCNNGVCTPLLTPTPYSFGFVCTPAATTGHCRLMFGFGTIDGITWLDNIECRKVLSGGSLGSNIVANGTFEIDLSSVTFENGGSGINITATRDTTGACNGVADLRLEKDRVGTTWWQAQAKFFPQCEVGARYQCNFLAQTSAPEGVGQANRLIIQYVRNDDPFTYCGQKVSAQEGDENALYTFQLNGTCGQALQ